MPIEIRELTVRAVVDGDEHDTLVAAVELLRDVDREQIGSDDQAWTPEQVLAYLSTQRYHAKIIWVAVDDGRVVGVSRYERAHDRTDPTAVVGVDVAADRRREGIGRRLLAVALERCRATGVTAVHAHSLHPDLTTPPRLAAPTGVGDLPADDASVRFGTAAGFVLGQVEVMSALALPVPAALLERLAAGLRPAPAYDLISWVGATPAELVDEYARLRTVMSTAAPAGGLTEVEQVWDAERVRDRDARNLEMGMITIMTAAREIRTGSLVGFTGLNLDGRPGHAIGQGYTLVLPGHRGHHLGLRIKINNLRLLAEHPHSARRVITGNAGENDAMLSINRALGYRPAWLAGWWELALD